MRHDTELAERESPAREADTDIEAELVEERGDDNVRVGHVAPDAIVNVRSRDLDNNAARCDKERKANDAEVALPLPALEPVRPRRGGRCGFVFPVSLSLPFSFPVSLTLVLGRRARERRLMSTRGRAERRARHAQLVPEGPHELDEEHEREEREQLHEVAARDGERGEGAQGVRDIPWRTVGDAPNRRGGDHERALDDPPW